MTNHSDKSICELTEFVRKSDETSQKHTELVASESRYHSIERVFRQVSVSFIGLVIVAFYMGFDLVAKVQAQMTNTQTQDMMVQLPAQVIKALSILKQDEYEEAQQMVGSKECKQEPTPPECARAAQLVKKVEKAEKAWQEAGKASEPEQADDNSPQHPPQNNRTVNEGVFLTYVLWDVTKGVEEITTLTQTINMTISKMATLAGQAETSVVWKALLSLAENAYLDARKACSKDSQACNQPLVKEVDKVIAAVVCQEHPKTQGCPQPDIEKLIQECKDNRNQPPCKINEPSVLSTYLLWETVNGLHLAVSALTALEDMNNIHMVLQGVRTALDELKKMVNVMFLMNRNMEMMRHDMGIMRHDMDSTMGRMGRGMSWMPWGW
jgi:hypothetical protein